jgi:hypothetical protein
MAKRPQLTCTDDQFHGIHAALAKVKRTSATVTVDKAALQALLIDHAALQKLADGR